MWYKGSYDLKLEICSHSTSQDGADDQDDQNEEGDNVVNKLNENNPFRRLHVFRQRPEKVRAALWACELFICSCHWYNIRYNFALNEA